MRGKKELLVLSSHHSLPARLLSLQYEITINVDMFQMLIFVPLFIDYGLFGCVNMESQNLSVLDIISIRYMTLLSFGCKDRRRVKFKIFLKLCGMLSYLNQNLVIPLFALRGEQYIAKTIS